jgi:Flp pilus assembly protein TadG
MLVPALVLVLVVLAAIAVDSAVVFLGERQLGDTAAAAANDAVSALSDPSFYRAGNVDLDPTAARRVADASVAAQDHSGVTIDGPVEVQVEGRQVCVSLTGHVDAIFGRAIPGVPHATTVRARATATAAGDRGTTVQHRSLC